MFWRVVVTLAVLSPPTDVVWAQGAPGAHTPSGDGTVNFSSRDDGAARAGPRSLGGDREGGRNQSPRKMPIKDLIDYMDQANATPQSDLDDIVTGYGNDLLWLDTPQ